MSVPEMTTNTLVDSILANLNILLQRLEFLIYTGLFTEKYYLSCQLHFANPSTGQKENSKSGVESGVSIKKAVFPELEGQT